MQPSYPLLNIRNREIPPSTQCIVCFAQKDNSGRKWAYHVGSVKHLLHIKCWKQILDRGFNCPACQVKVGGGDVLPLVRFITPGRVSIYYRIMERVLPRNERFPVFVQQNWKVYSTSCYLAIDVINVVAVYYIFIKRASSTQIVARQLSKQVFDAQSEMGFLAVNLFIISGVIVLLCIQTAFLKKIHTAAKDVIEDRFRYAI